MLIPNFLVQEDFFSSSVISITVINSMYVGPLIYSSAKSADLK